MTTTEPAGLRTGSPSLAALVAGADAAWAQDDHCAGRERHVIRCATPAVPDPAWEMVHRGAEQGALDNRLEVKWTQDQVFGMEGTSNRMRTAISEEPDMLVITATDPVAMRPTVERAVEAGIPVIAINTLDRASKGERMPCLIGIGADLYQSGVATAEPVIAANPDVKHGLVPIHAPGHVGLEAMAKGLADTLEAHGATAEVIAVTSDAAATAVTVSNYPLANPETDATFCMNAGALCFGTVLGVERRENRTGDVTNVSFDVSPALLDAIGSGEAVAGIDQIMCLQGCLPAVVRGTASTTA